MFTLVTRRRLRLFIICNWQRFVSFSALTHHNNPKSFERGCHPVTLWLILPSLDPTYTRGSFSGAYHALPDPVPWWSWPATPSCWCFEGHRVTFPPCARQPAAHRSSLAYWTWLGVWEEEVQLCKKLAPRRWATFDGKIISIKFTSEWNFDWRNLWDLLFFCKGAGVANRYIKT